MRALTLPSFFNLPQRCPRWGSIIVGAQFNVMPGTSRQRGGREAGAPYSVGTSNRQPGWAGALCFLPLAGRCRWSKPVGLCRAQVWAHLFLVRQDTGPLPSEGSPVVVVDGGCQAGVLSRPSILHNSNRTNTGCACESFRSLGVVVTFPSV